MYKKPNPLTMKAAYLQNKRQLEAARELAAAAQSQALQKSSLLSEMSHEIRTPMNAILGFTELAELAHIKGDSGKMADYLGKIRLAATQLLHLINNILDYSGMENGKVKILSEAFVLSDTVHTTLDRLRPESERQGLAFTAELDFAHDAVIGDSLRLQQILTNLLTNAVKYTPAGGHVDLTVQELEDTCSGIPSYRFTVTDDGIGMSDEFLQRLFTPYERASSQVSRTEGTGLGMSITAKLVSLMQGTIQVASKSGEGTTVTVVLPFRLA